ncbi:MAG: hypothetical protein RSG77_22780 [Hafnia sp.]
MQSPYSWIESVFADPKIPVIKKPVALLRLIDAIEDPLEFSTDQLGEQIDWQIFLKVFFDQHMVIKSSWPVEKGASALFDHAGPGSLLDQIRHAGEQHFPMARQLSEMLAQVVGQDGMTKKPGNIKFKLTQKAFFSLLTPTLLAEWKASGVHWRILQSVLKEKLMHKGIRYVCTHNAKDFDSSASALSSVLCSETPLHPYIGFHSTKRTTYVSCGNGSDLFYQRFASMSVNLAGKIRTFIEYFTNDTLRQALLSAGAPAALIAEIRDFVEQSVGTFAPEHIDPLFKQIYWVCDEGNFLITPLIAGSMQVDLHNFISLSEEEKAIKGRKPDEVYQRLATCYPVQRIGSNFSNAGGIAQKLFGRHNLLKCLPPSNVPDLYWRFHAMTKRSRLVGKFDKIAIKRLYNLATSDYSNASMREAAKNHAERLATSIASNFHDVVAFSRKQGDPWVTKHATDNNCSRWLHKAAFGTLSPEEQSDIAEEMLEQVHNEHLNNEVRQLTRHQLKSILEASI